MYSFHYQLTVFFTNKYNINGMALIGSIRKHFWFVLIILGLALAAFILMDMQGSANRSGSAMVMGEIAGQKIDYREFSRAESALYSGNPDVFGRRNSLWNYFIEKSIVDEQAEDLGLSVTKSELMDLQFGTRLSPIVENNFRNQQTRQVDRQTLLQYKQAIENDEPLNSTFRNFWAEQENQIIKAELQNKLGNLVSKGIYTPTFLVEETGALSNSSLDLRFVKIPFDNIDGDVEVSDADITTYIKENTLKYTSKEETRVLEYAVIDVFPTSEDSAFWKKSIVELRSDFQSTDSDSLFAFNNNGFYSNLYYSNDDLPDGLKGNLYDVAVGTTYGPYRDQGSYFIAKLLDKKILPDSVSASHILRRVNTGTPEEYAAANTYIDSLHTLLNRGTRFDTLATNNSEDPGSGAKGGDLGTFVQGAMVPTFNDAVFQGKTGGVYKVQTQFGVHLIKVTNQVFNNRENKYKIAFIRNAIIPSETTQNRLFDQLADLITDNRSMESLRTATTALGYNFQSSEPRAANDYILGALGSDNSSRDMVKWAYEYDTEIGNVSPVVYTYTDKVNYYNNKYVIAGLKGVQEAGLFSAASMRSTLEPIVANQKKAESILAGLGSDLNSIAAQYGTKVDTARSISMNASFVPGIGAENKVVATAFGTAVNTSANVIGTSGVFVLSPFNKTEGTAGSIPSMRQVKTRSSISQAELKTMEALKKTTEITDSRATFF